MRFLAEILRVALGLLAAAATAATFFTGVGIAMILWEGPNDATLASGIFAAIGLWPIACIVALAHAVVLGLPLYAALRWFGAIRWWVGPICGFVVGALPYAIFFGPWNEASSFSQVNDKILVENGTTTLAGWIAYAEFAAGLGALGAAGGLAAWLTWGWLGGARAGAAR